MTRFVLPDKSLRDPKLAVADDRLDPFVVRQLERISARNSVEVKSLFPAKSNDSEQKLVVGSAQTVAVLGTQRAWSTSVQLIFHRLRCKQPYFQRWQGIWADHILGSYTFGEIPTQHGCGGWSQLKYLRLCGHYHRGRQTGRLPLALVHRLD